MEHHYTCAKSVGATDEEIAESVAIAMTVSAGKRRSVAREVISQLNKG